MELSDLMIREGVFPSLKAKTKKRALQELSERAATIVGLPAQEIHEALAQRERLGSTGLGRGIAIPHAKLAELKGIHCLFARLETPIDFEALDGEPVDLVFVLLAPEHASGDHLKALAKISRLLRESSTLERLRGARDRDGLYAILTQPVTSHAA